MKTISAIVAALALVIGCTAAQQAVINSAAGGVCEVVFQATDPSLSSLCTTGEDVAQAIEALVAAHAAIAADAGLAASPVVYHPTNAEIYGYLVAHGAVTVKH